MAEDNKENQDLQQGSIKVSVQLEGFAQASELEKAQKDIENLKSSLSEQELPKEEIEKKLAELEKKVVEVESKLQGEKDSILKALSKELKLRNKNEVVESFKELKEIKETRKKEKVSPNADLLGNLKSKVESGEGLITALSGSIKEKSASINKAFSVKGAKSFGRTLGKSMFAGDDILSAYMRGRFAEPKSKTKKETPKIEAMKDVVSDGKLSPVETKTPTPEKESVDEATLNIVAKNTMSLPDIARDMNVLRQNMQQLVEIWSSNEDKEKAKEDKKKVYATSADMMFHTESEMRKRTEVQREEFRKVDSEKESEEERAADVSFFEEQDKKEAELEAGRLKPSGEETGATKETKEDGKFDLSSLLNIGKVVKSLVSKVVSSVARGLISAFKFLFKPGNILKLLMRVALPIAIIGSLFSGIMDGFKKYKETGSFSEAIVAGLGGMLSFLTFGLFGEDTLKNLWDKVSGFFEPVMSTITGIFKGIKDFFKKMFGGTVDVEDTDPKVDATKPAMPDTKSFVPGKETKTEPPKTEAAPPATPPAPAPTPTSPTPAAKTPATTPTPTAAPAKGGKTNDVYLTPDEEKRADPLIQKMMEYQKQIKALNDDYSIPKEERKSKRKEIASKQKEVSDELDKIKPDLGNQVLGYTQDQLINLEKESSKSLMEKMNQDFKTISNEKAQPKKEEPKAKAVEKSSFTKTTTLTQSEKTTTGEELTKEAKSAREQKLGLAEKYAQKAAPIVKKLYAEGKIQERFATEEDYQNIPELAALRKEKEEELAKLNKIEKAGTTEITKKSSSASVGNTSSGAGSVSASTKGITEKLHAGGISAQPPTSGSELSSASSQIAEGQRMESAADTGSVVNSPVTNNTNGVSGNKSKPKSTTAYNEDLAMMLSGT
jgi:hypothetical protein